MNEKPFKSIDEQIALLSSRGLEITPDTREILMREGYYSVVNGYKDPFIVTDDEGGLDDERFVPGTSFDDLYSLFRFDMRLREITFKYVLRIESLIKTVATYTFAERHRDGNSYLEPSNYGSQREYRELGLSNYGSNMNKLQRSFIDAIEHPRNEAVEYYVETYGYVPIWVLSSTLTFGTIEHFFNLLSRSDQNLICKRIVDLTNRKVEWHDYLDPINARRAIDIVVKFRNICAHDERLYCARVDRRNPVDYFGFVEYASNFMDILDYLDLIKSISNLVGKSNQSSTALAHLLDAMGYNAMLDNLLRVGDRIKGGLGDLSQG